MGPLNHCELLPVPAGPRHVDLSWASLSPPWLLAGTGQLGLCSPRAFAQPEVPTGCALLGPAFQGSPFHGLKHDRSGGLPTAPWFLQFSPSLTPLEEGPPIHLVEGAGGFMTSQALANFETCVPTTSLMRSRLKSIPSDPRKAPAFSAGPVTLSWLGISSCSPFTCFCGCTKA